MIAPMTRFRGFMMSVLCVAGLSTAAHAEKLNMAVGLWEMTGDMEMAGQKMPATKIEHCITKKDLDGTWWQELPKGMDCKIDQKVTAKTASWTMSCKMNGGGKMTSVGKMSYTRKSFKGTATMKMTIPNAGVQSGSMKMSGKYIGPCKK